MAETEDRTQQLENLVYELPGLMNSRLDGLEGHIRAFRLSSENQSDRLARVERVLGMLQTDVRDLRSGVTAQLKGQDERIAGLDTRLLAIEQLLVRQDARVAGLETLLRAIATKLDIS